MSKAGYIAGLLGLMLVFTGLFLFEGSLLPWRGPDSGFGWLLVITGGLLVLVGLITVGYALVNAFRGSPDTTVESDIIETHDDIPR